MIRFTTFVRKFGQKGEKTGWTYIEIPADLATELNPDSRKAFRVKGKLDSYSFNGKSLVPMGAGDYILALNQEMRKASGKQQGDEVQVLLEPDHLDPPLSSDFLECLGDDPPAKAFYKTLPGSHQRYFSTWIESAKTIETKSKRITQALKGLSMKMGYSEMIRYFKKQKS